MKKLILPVAAFSMLFLTSCGGTSVCGCMDSYLEMSKEMKAANGDEAKMKAIEEKYKDEEEACRKLDEGKTSDEKEKMQEEAKKCDAYKELENL